MRRVSAASLSKSALLVGHFFRSLSVKVLCLIEPDEKQNQIPNSHALLLRQGQPPQPVKVDPLPMNQYRHVAVCDSYMVSPKVPSLDVSPVYTQTHQGIRMIVPFLGQESLDSESLTEDTVTSRIKHPYHNGGENLVGTFLSTRVSVLKIKFKSSMWFFKKINK